MKKNYKDVAVEIERIKVVRDNGERAMKIRINITEKNGNIHMLPPMYKIL